MLGQSQKGTLGGEFRRAIALFKSFPVSTISKHWMRGWGQPTAGGKAAYLASYLVASTILGALAMQIKEIAKGHVPRNMDNKEAWIAAFLQGGGAGIFGDYLFNDHSRYGKKLIESAVGPILGLGQDVYDLTLGNMLQAAKGEPTDAGAEAVRFIQGNTPGMSLWYARAALDHLMFHQLQEYVSPGYLSRMRKRDRENGVTGYWWAPGQVAPGG
jgi:hypothetical protein